MYDTPGKGRPSIFLLVVLLSFFASCEKEVNINLDGEAPKVVVQGVIETGAMPYVMLSSTMSFFSSVDLKTFENSFLHGAKITINDGTKTITLREYALDTTNAKFYIYGPDTAGFNPANFMFGQFGKNYLLTIVYDGKTYTANTKIPEVKGPDTVWFAPPLFSRNNTPKTAKQLFANYQDPDTIGNYVRYYTRRNKGQFNPGGVFTDEAVNGKLIKNIAMFSGDQNNDTTRRDSTRYFYPGDTVTLKWSEIDKGVYTFWNTFQFAVNSVGNPFSSPINVSSNVSNGAVGVWAGYGVWQKTLVVPQ